MKKFSRMIVVMFVMVSLVIIGCSTVYATEGEYAYNVDKALTYADNHYSDTKAYDGGAQDCAKFVRKCVEAGGVPVENRSYGYTPGEYVDYLIKSGYADYYKLKLTPHTWNPNRFYVDGSLNADIVKPGDVLVYNCTMSKCPKSCFHLELVHETEGQVTCYGHNPSKGPEKSNDNVITFPHGKCKENGATDMNTEIWVLHFKEDPNLFCKHASANKSVITPATFDAEGEMSVTCNDCLQTFTEIIPAVTSVKLGKNSYTFDNKVKTPVVYVKNSSNNSLNKVTKSSSNGFMVKYATGRKNVGTYKVTVTLTGERYEGQKILTFKISPKGVSISKLVPAKNAFTVKWLKPTLTNRKQITGYQIRYSTSSSNLSKATPVKIKSTTAISKKISKLKAKKTYYVQLRTYKIVKGQYYYSGWSAKKSVKTK